MFKSSTGEVAICEHCRSVVVRKGADVESIGEMAALPPDQSPLKVGSVGAINGLGFTLLGRLRIQWTGGSWSEWFVEYADHTRGWVGEAQGFFMVLRETPLNQTPSFELTDLSAGQSVTLNGAVYQVTDSKPVQCIGGEGELPDPVKPGEPWQSVDLERSDGFVATLEQSENGWRFFEGRAAMAGELSWQNLRTIPGWNGVPLETEHHQTMGQNCPSCGGVVSLRAAGLTMTAVCSHCGTVLDTSTPQLQIVQKAVAKRHCKPSIPLGQRGHILGADWEMIGFMQRRDSEAAWQEYLLYNPFQGFRWLTEFEGRWTWMDRLLRTPSVAPSDFDEEEDDSQVTYVEGEFYWQVRRGESSLVSEVKQGATLISRERYPGLNEITYSTGFYVEPRDVAKAFGTSPPPSPDVNSLEEKWKSLKPIMLIFLVAVLVTHWVTATFGKGGGKPFEMNGRYTKVVTPKTLLPTIVQPTPTGSPQATTLPTPPKDPNTQVSAPFEIKHQGAVDVDANAPVDNSWLGLDVTLINQKTGESYGGYISVEYYYGSDSDGPWSEGGRSATTSIPGVPAGTYTLSVNTEADAPIRTMPYTVSVRGGGTYLSNFFLAVFLLLVWPAITLFRRHGYAVSHKTRRF